MTVVVLLHEGLEPSLALAPDGGGRVRPQEGPAMAVTPQADRCALERALALTDRVVAVTVGAREAAGPLAYALARGAVRAVRVWDDALDGADLAATSGVLALVVRALGADVVLAGSVGSTGGTGMLPALVAARLGWPCLDGVLAISRDPEGLSAVRRLAGGWREELVTTLPAVASVTAESADLRYVSGVALRRAERRGHEAWDLTRLEVDASTVRAWTHLRVAGLDWPRPRAKRTARADRGGSAADRMRRLLSGGSPAPASPRTTPASPEDRVVDGPPVVAAERILEFLATRGLLSPPVTGQGADR